MPPPTTIDLSHQILLVASNGVVTRIYDIATGASATPTPAGRFEIYHQIDGFAMDDLWAGGAAPIGTPVLVY